MTQEALKLALEALERSVATCFDQYAHQQVMSQPDHFINQTITSLRQAIAELESQDGACQQCGGKGCVACDARKVAHDVF
jgi:N-methylhydantoinase B/oxoprolinase/acetone carboxylase alpha subunit